MSPAAILDSIEAEQAALQAADDLFFHRGVGGVAMAEIRDQSGVSLRRLYSMYPSKSDLVAEWLQYRHRAWLAGFAERVNTRLSSGANPIDAIFWALETWLTDTNFRGCGFINTCAESSELTDEHREIIRMHKRAVADYLETLTPLGPAIAVLVDGVIMQAAIFESSEPIRLARRAASAMAPGSDT